MYLCIYDEANDLKKMFPGIELLSLLVVASCLPVVWLYQKQEYKKKQLLCLLLLLDREDWCLVSSIVEESVSESTTRVWL